MRKHAIKRTRHRLATTSWWALPCAAALSLAGACKKSGPSAPPPGMTTPGERICRDGALTVGAGKEPEPEVSCSAKRNEIQCYGQWAAHCGSDNKLVDLTNCRAHGKVCAPRSCSGKDCDGCHACRPGTVHCGDGGERTLCRDDGSGYDPADSCDESQGLRCSLESGMCEDLCAAAEQEKSYIGCDYYAVATSNSALAFDSQDENGLCQPFTFAVVVANSQGVRATVQVESPGQPARAVTVEPSEAKAIELPCTPELKGKTEVNGMPDPRFSVDVKAAAHHLRSDVPVTMYQFNPLEFESTGMDGEPIYSLTNDSSILLPTSSLTGDYVVMAWPTRMDKFVPISDRTQTFIRSAPGFVAITGVDADPVEVEIESSAYTLPSSDGKIPALAPGDHYTFDLAQGEVVQLLSAAPNDCSGKPADVTNGAEVTYCDVGDDYDLTGTHVHSEGRLSVISGHDCAFVPHDRWACDHLEETMFPSESWGREIVVSLSANVNCETDLPNIARVLSSADGNHLSFVPAAVHPSVTLAKGEFLEFEYTQDFVASADAPILIAQYLVGQEYKGIDSAAPNAEGDPSLSLAIPTEQWRSNYPFLIPETYTDNYVNIIARTHQLILIDGRVVSDFNPIKGTNLVIGRLRVDPGQHVAQSQTPFGIVIYGYAAYTSYMMPGGLDLQPITHVF